MRSSSSTSTVRPYRQINESLYELYAPAKGEAPTVKIILFHGLHLGAPEDAFWKTWTNGDECWPQTWLTREANLPRARVLSVAYDASLIKSDKVGRLELYNIGENLVLDIILSTDADVGRCPVILVGHSLGGLVIKQMILHAEQAAHEVGHDPRLGAFLENLAGVFYFSTPHTGADISNFTRLFDHKGPVTSVLSMLNSDVARLNEGFRKWRRDHGVKAYAVAETEETCVGRYCGYVVTKASARVDVDQFYLCMGDHFTICAPEPPATSSALHLLMYLIQTTTHEHPQHVPKSLSEHVPLPIDSDSKFVLLKALFLRSRVHWKLNNNNLRWLPCMGGQVWARVIWPSLLHYTTSKKRHTSMMECSTWIVVLRH